MKIVNIILRVALGGLLVVFGLNKFLGFMPDFEFGTYLGAKNFFDSLTATGYMWPLVGGLEITVGVLLIIKKAMPAALLALLTISINIVLFHAVLDPPHIGPALAVALLNAYFIYINRTYYKPLIKA